MITATQPTESVNADTSSFGQKIAWIVFLATSLHLAFLVPSGNLIMPGERAKIFSGLLCAVSLLLALLFGNKGSLNRKSPEIWISMVLFALAVLSTCLSSDPGSSIPRAFVIVSSGLGGFWCAGLLIHNHKRAIFFQWFCLVVLALLLAIAILGIVVSGTVYQYLDTNWHALGSRIVILSFAPLALCLAGTGWKRTMGLSLLVFGYAVLVMSGRAAGAGANVMIPAALCLVAIFLRKWRPRQIVVLLLLMLLMCAGIARHLFIHCRDIDKNHQSIAYRIESVFFSWHIAKQKWLLGNGLWAPREAYLEDYDMKYPYLTKARFTKWTKELRISENYFLTFMADLGLPFVLLYSVSLIILFRKLLLQHFKKIPDVPFPPLALLLPIVGEFLHLLVYDGLFHPQSSWFFHVLLGLIVASENLRRIKKGSKDSRGQGFK